MDEVKCHICFKSFKSEGQCADHYFETHKVTEINKYNLWFLCNIRFKYIFKK